MNKDVHVHGMDLQELGIFGNTFCFQELYKWIERIANSAFGNDGCGGCLLLLGPPGVGKTYAVDVMCNRLGVKIKKVDSTHCKTAKELGDILRKMFATDLTDIFLDCNTKKLIFIDELEVLLNTDRNIPSYIRQLFANEAPNIPVVIACNSNVEKRLGDIKREWRLISLKYPSEADIMLMLKWYTGRHGIKAPCDILLSVSEMANGNMQQALKSMSYELLIASDTISSGSGAIDKMPNIDMLYNTTDRKLAVALFEEDTWMNPLRFHENLPGEIETRKGTKKTKAVAYSSILRCMLEWDVMQGYMDDKGAVNTNIPVEHLCNAPCSILASLERKKNAQQVGMEKFTKMLSQLSLHKKLERQTYQDGFPWKHVGAYFYTIKQKKRKFSTVDTDS